MAEAAEQVLPILSNEKQDRLDTVAAELDQRQLLWASGYLAGLAAGRHTSRADGAALPGAMARGEPATGHVTAQAQEKTATPAAAAQVAEKVAVLYASETGNSRRTAQTFAARLRGEGYEVLLNDLAQYSPRQLRRETQVVFVTATHGLGDPPEGTEVFFEYWNQDNAPRLDSLNYAVLALGDSSYDDFCQVGIDLDNRLQTLGAKRLYARVDCDLDFEADATVWSDRVYEALVQRRPKTLATPIRVTPVPQIHAVRTPVHSRARPYAAELLLSQRITGRDSSKDVRHIELSLEDSGLSYLPGDSLGVWPTNPPALVDALLSKTGLSADAAVSVGDDAMTLHAALSDKLEITASSRGFVQAWASATGDTQLAQHAQAKGLKSWLDQRQVIDIVREHPGDIDAQTFANSLRGLTPRLYSIASSPDANPDEAHLTVGVVAYEAFGLAHSGAASSYLAAGPDRVPVFVERNDRFRLPQDNDVPIIMIGAGTGIAPYRAFLQQRQHLGASGGNWLVYGDRKLHSDFLYQLEILRYRREGLLTELDVAFSRDQAGKIYVQHRLIERGRQLYDWLQQGAGLYVCGDADHMAPDVHAALTAIVVEHGGLDKTAAEAWLTELKRDGRYQRDVY